MKTTLQKYFFMPPPKIHGLMPVDKWRTVARRIDKYHGRTYMVGGFIGLILVFFAVFFMGARAEELHVDSGGNFFIVSSPVTSTNNNFITVSVWGTNGTCLSTDGRGA